jgi:hypothetical protein
MRLPAIPGPPPSLRPAPLPARWPLMTGLCIADSRQAGGGARTLSWPSVRECSPVGPLLLLPRSESGPADGSARAADPTRHSTFGRRGAPQRARHSSIAAGRRAISGSPRRGLSAVGRGLGVDLSLHGVLGHPASIVELGPRAAPETDDVDGIAGEQQAAVPTASPALVSGAIVGNTCSTTKYRCVDGVSSVNAPRTPSAANAKSTAAQVALSTVVRRRQRGAKRQAATPATDAAITATESHTGKPVTSRARGPPR